MILKRARVQNFRAIRDATVEFGNHTAILGGNGAGKSTILRAIERFYSPSATVEPDDFFGRRFNQPIDITLTFSEFNDDERERFGDRIRNGEMSVSRIFEGGGGRTSGRYFGRSLQYPPFAGIRASEVGAREKRAAFNALAPELGLPNAANADELAARMSEWEHEHPEHCEDRLDDGAFFGFANVARGNLQKSTSFVFIPAVRDASADSVDGRGAVVAKLMELVVRSAVQQREDVRSFQERVSGEYRELVDPARLPELNELATGLSDTLRDYYPDAGVALRWQPPSDFTVPLPTADVLLEEDGFRGPVDRKGHGLQRAFIVTLLQHLARAGSADQNAAADVNLVPEPQPDYVLPGLILAIEEPELYQHPTKQRHFAKVLRRLTDGTLPGVAARTQVMFASHSPLFVSLDRFDEVRLARRRVGENGAEKECAITSSTLDRVADRLAEAHQAAPGRFTAATVRPRLHIIGPELAEGFFGDLVVLTEGISDRAALMAAAQMEGFDLEAMGVAVLWVDGKTKLDKPALVFQELGIPTYVVFDCDNHAGDLAAPNRALQRLHGADQVLDACERVEDLYACFEDKLERTIRADLTQAVFDAVVAQTQIALGMEDRDEVLKSPAAMTMVLGLAKAEGRECASLNAIVHKIRERRAAL